MLSTRLTLFHARTSPTATLFQQFFSLLQMPYVGGEVLKYLSVREWVEIADEVGWDAWRVLCGRYWYEQFRRDTIMRACLEATTDHRECLEDVVYRVWSEIHLELCRHNGLYSMCARLPIYEAVKFNRRPSEWVRDSGSGSMSTYQRQFGGGVTPVGGPGKEIVYDRIDQLLGDFKFTRMPSTHMFHGVYMGTSSDIRRTTFIMSKPTTTMHKWTKEEGAPPRLVVDNFSDACLADTTEEDDELFEEWANDFMDAVMNDPFNF